MQGGLKVYAGAPAAARHYVEADRARADDYYLTEGTGVAHRFTAGPDRPVTELAPLTGDAYETWVAGLDPDSGEPRGRLRSEARAVRFVEVVVNGPKSWSLAAALHSDIAAAYDAAQDRAAAQILGWLAQHATTRVGPAGGQVQVPIEVLEAVTVAHHTSRAGDPHRHLHLQINARVFAAGTWRGLHTVGVRDSLGAINGIGHATMACDPQFRAALAAHGYSTDGTGEIRELADYVGPMSARNAQIARNVDRYEREWTATHPGETAGPALRRSWDTRAWAQDRPDKVTPQSGADLTERWRAQLHGLGYRDPSAPVLLVTAPIGALDRDAVVGRALTRLGAARSAWNRADVRSEVERLIAAEGVIAEPVVRAELAEDLTARAVGQCVPLLVRDGIPVPVPEHIRALTSPRVLDVEADLTTRLAARAGTGLPDIDLARSPTEPAPRVDVAAARGLDVGQAAAVAALVGDRALVVLEGAAGAGKTTTLAATRTMVERSGHRLVVATPTLKAANVAETEVGARAGSAAALVFAHGWRWSAEGAWTRLAPGQADPATGGVYTGPSDRARLRPGDLLVVDEAGMLDQDTARALLTVADECQVRIALLGDRHQLAAVGRGGVLDLAARAVDPAGHLTLEGVHRFVRTDPAGRTGPDTEYAQLTLAMRTGADPSAVFDALVTRAQIRIHPDAAALQDAVAATAAVGHGTGEQVAVVVNTRQQAADLNAAIRDQLIRAGRVDDTRVTTNAAGQRIGEGDRIATRRNDRDLGVANRDTWTVTAVGPGGELLISPADRAPGPVPPARGSVTPARGGVTPASAAVSPAEAGQRVLPAGYVTAHVELAYATTAYGVQGDTVPTAHVVVGESTGAASAYVGMTRGREANTAHLVAADVQEAREQWIAVFARDRADLGPAHAAQQAVAEVARYAPSRPLEQVLAELRAAWTAEQVAQFRLAITEPVCDRLQQLVELDWKPEQRMDGLHARERAAWADVEHADRQLRDSEVVVRADVDRIRQQLLDAWDGQRGGASQAAAVVLHGPGRFGQRRAAVARAGEQLTDWADAWRPYLAALPADPRAIAELADRSDDRPALWRVFDAAAHRGAEQAHPEHAALQSAAATARTTYVQAARARERGRREQDEMVARFGRVADTPDPAATLVDIDREITAARTDLAASQARVAHLIDEPALRGQPPELLTRERDAWQASRDADHRRRPVAVPRAPDPSSGLSHVYRYDRAAGRSGPAPGLGR